MFWGTYTHNVLCQIGLSNPQSSHGMIAFCGGDAHRWWYSSHDAIAGAARLDNHTLVCICVRAHAPTRAFSLWVNVRLLKLKQIHIESKDCITLSPLAIMLLLYSSSAFPLKAELSILFGSVSFKGNRSFPLLYFFSLSLCLSFSPFLIRFFILSLIVTVFVCCIS